MQAQRLNLRETGPQAALRGDTVYVAGQVAERAAGMSVAAQTSEILARIESLLLEAGSGKPKLLAAQIWMADLSSLNEVNAVWDGWIGKNQTPARAVIEARLDTSEHAVKIAVTAAR